MKTFYKKQHYTHIFFCMCIYCVCLQHGESEGQRRIKKKQQTRQHSERMRLKKQ